MAHNGYTNADTYHVAAHFDNIEPLYTAAKAARDENDLRASFDENRELFPPDIDADNVNWIEVFDRYFTGF